MNLEIHIKVLHQSFHDLLISKSLHGLSLYFVALLYIRHDYKYWSKILYSAIPTPAYDLEVKVTGLEMYVCIKVYKISLISKSLHGFTLYCVKVLPQSV